MKLVEKNELGEIEFSAEALGVYPFSEIVRTNFSRAKKYEAIKGDNNGRLKTLALRELLFIHFITVYDSRFATTKDEIERIEKVKKFISLPDDWEPDTLVLEGISVYYDANLTESYSLYRTAVEGQDKLREFLNDFDLQKETKSGGLVLKPTEYQAALERLPNTIAKVKEAKSLVQQETDALKQRAGGKGMTLFESEAPYKPSGQ